MAAKQCDCGNERMHALAVESAVFESLRNAQAQPDREGYWRDHADKLEGKFTTQHGRHYSHFTRQAASDAAAQRRGD